MILDHCRRGRLHELWLEHRGDRFLALANLSGRPAAWPIPESLRTALLFDQLKTEIVSASPPALRLAAHETKLLKISFPGPAQVVGTGLHLLGGKADVAELRVAADGEISLALVPGLRAGGGIWLALAEDGPPRAHYAGRALPIMEEHGRFKVVEIRPVPEPLT